MPELKLYSIFISHAWTYNEEYYRLVEMLKNASLFNWRNYSVPKHDPLDTTTDKELEIALYDQIKPTNIVIILSGMYVNYRKWIQKEIDIALHYRKPIIGIKPRGQERIPREVQDITKEMVGWNTNSIVTAIRKRAI